jgi:hypothetical protein
MNKAINDQSRRPPLHENVSEDLIIYALPHWECPASVSTEEEQDGDGGSKLRAVFFFLVLSGAIGFLSVL